MTTPLRSLVATVSRPAGAALDRRFDDLERRLMDRLDRLEERVSVDADTTAELTATQRRVVERLEMRLATLEAVLAELTAAGREPGALTHPDQ